MFVPWTPDNRLYSWFVFSPFLFPFNEVVFHFSPTLNPSRFPCQCGIAQTYFLSDFVSGENYDITVFVSSGSSTYTPMTANWPASGGLTPPTFTWKSLLKNGLFTVSNMCSVRTNIKENVCPTFSLKPHECVSKCALELST